MYVLSPVLRHRHSPSAARDRSLCLSCIPCCLTFCAVMAATSCSLHGMESGFAHSWTGVIHVPFSISCLQRGLSTGEQQISRSNPAAARGSLNALNNIIGLHMHACSSAWLERIHRQAMFWLMSCWKLPARLCNHAACAGVYALYQGVHCTGSWQCKSWCIGAKLSTSD